MIQEYLQLFEKEAVQPAGQNQADSCLYRRSTAGRKHGQSAFLPVRSRKRCEREKVRSRVRGASGGNR